MQTDPLWERQAIEVIDAFASVGVERFFVIYVNMENKGVGHGKFCSVEELRRNIGRCLQKGEQYQQSLVIKPEPTRSYVCMLDDLNADVMQKIEPAAFVVLETSPGSYHTWLAIGDGDVEFWRRTKKGTGSDSRSAFASRISGCHNFKTKYAPHFPLVKTHKVTPGLIVSKADLEALGIVAPVEEAPKQQRGGHASYASKGRRRPLDYERWANNPNAPQKDGKRDRSRIDFTWCQTCIERGYSIEETAALLMEVSEKAAEDGMQYALLTARKAAESQGGMPPPHAV